MATFPSIAGPSLPIRVLHDDPAIKTETEGGYEMTRPRYTRIRREWHLVWPAMTGADLTTLQTFYRDTTLGGTLHFTWTSPTDGVAYTVRFAEKFEPEAIAWKKDQTVKYWAVQIRLKEV